MKQEKNFQQMEAGGGAASVSVSAKKTVLIVDDNAVNRQILRRILSQQYEVLEATDGREALDVFEEHQDRVAAIMLDLVMPGMNGYDFLREFSKREISARVPVIVSTGQTDKDNEIEALSLGAWDFVGKPYVPKIIQFRLENAILRSQLTAWQELKYKSEYDVLTGIYNKDKFFEMTHDMLTAHPDERFSYLRFDIDRFHLVNAYFGMKTGDDVLRFISGSLREKCTRGYHCATYGRVEADVFAFCIPTQQEEAVRAAVDETSSWLKKYELAFDMVPSFGVYLIEDNALAVDEIDDRAHLAAKSCKGSYLTNYAVYEPDMGKRVEQEQEIINEMNAAIEGEQFEIWYQPKYDIRTNAPAGAEALVRWRHPQKGMIPPGTFVPVFEHNGFVSKLDFYVWEHVCRDLRRWMDEGRRPHPVSVNVSRVDLSDSRLLDRIDELTQRYRVPHELLNLELTESAYTDNPGKMIHIMREFQERGYVILMDDFGSGYSSLSVLKDIDVNVLKIDMRFFSKTAVEGRGRSIIASVVRMAKWLRIPVVAEGVETREQVEFLRGLGCEYVQGYYFAKPMPAADYDGYVDSRQPFAAPGAKEAFDPNKIWNNDSLVNDVMQPAAVFEWDQHSLEILRVNNTYYDLFGYDDQAGHFQTPLRFVAPEYRQDVKDAFRAACETRGSAEVDFQHLRVSETGPLWVHLKIKFIDQMDEKRIFYGVYSDVTALKRLDQELATYRAAGRDQRDGTGRLLIVDDMEINREALKAIFMEKYELLEAADGQMALDVLERVNGGVDAVLLDLGMPVMDGRTFLKRIKADERFAAIPVVIITADESSAQQAETIALGASDYIVKPFVSGVVARRVENVLDAQARVMKQLRETRLNAPGAALE